MTATLATTTRVSSTPALFSPVSLLLAAVVALEIVGVRALTPDGTDAAAVVASIDGTDVAAPARHLRAASVEVRIVAQADLPAR